MLLVLTKIVLSLLWLAVIGACVKAGSLPKTVDERKPLVFLTAAILVLLCVLTFLLMFRGVY